MVSMIPPWCDGPAPGSACLRDYAQPSATPDRFQELPDAELVWLEAVSCFAPVQRPEVFDGAIAAFHARG